MGAWVRPMMLLHGVCLLSSMYLVLLASWKQQVVFCFWDQCLKDFPSPRTPAASATRKSLTKLSLHDSVVTSISIATIIAVTVVTVDAMMSLHCSEQPLPMASPTYAPLLPWPCLIPCSWSLSFESRYHPSACLSVLGAGWADGERSLSVVALGRQSRRFLRRLGASWGRYSVFSLQGEKGEGITRLDLLHFICLVGCPWMESGCDCASFKRCRVVRYLHLSSFLICSSIFSSSKSSAVR